MLSTLGPADFGPLLESCLVLTTDSRDYIRESFLSVFVYLPIIMEDAFEQHVFQVIQFTVESISHPKEGIRNLAIKSIKILIRRFLKKNIDLLIAPFFEGAVSSNSTKQNSSLILLGDILDILYEEFQDRERLYESYPRLMAIFYILKNDSCGEVRITATNIFKTFVDNPQKCLKIIANDLVDCFVELFLRENSHHDEIALLGLKEFSYKYGDTFLSKVLNYATFKKNQADVRQRRGIGMFVSHFVHFFNPSQLGPEKKQQFYDLLYNLYNDADPSVWEVAGHGLRVLAETAKDPRILEEVLRNYYPDYQDYDSANPKFDKLTALLCEFLKSKKQNIILFVVAVLVTERVSDWSLDVFLRNPRLLGSLLYACKPLERGIKYFLEGLGEYPKQTQEAIIFMAAELCSHVDQSKLPELIQDLDQEFQKARVAKDTPRLVDLLTLMRLYFEKMPVETIVAAQRLSIGSLELVAYQGADASRVYNELGRFLQVMLSVSSDDRRGPLMTAIYETLKRVINETKVYAGVENKETIASFVKLITSVLEVCNAEVSNMALKCLKFLVTKLGKQYFADHATALYGVMLRALSYRYVLTALWEDIPKT